jgi:hypothetical protein
VAFSYRDAQLAARQVAGRLSEGAVARIRAELTAEAERLATRLAALPAGTPAQTAATLQASVTLIRQLEQRLLAVGAKAIAEQRAVTFAEVATLWQRAALETASLKGIPNALMGAVRQPPITLLGAYEALGAASAHWKTALHGVVQAGTADLDAIVRHGLAQQVSPEELARGLRAYVVGAEPFHQAFGGEAFARVQDLRSGVPVHLREAGRKMAFNARRIAYSEVHNARAEAEVTHFAIDPMIGAVRWTLSPYRGEVVVPDVCDVLASSDFYGLGPGVYPIGKVPPPPHPFDRCERMPVTRAVSAAGAAKPYPVRLLPPTGVRIPARFRAGTTAAQEARILKQAEQVITAAEGWALQNPLQQVIAAGLPGGQQLVRTLSLHRAALLKSTQSAAGALPPAMPTAGPQLGPVPSTAAPPPPVKLGTFVVPGELAGQPGALDQVKALIKQHQNKSPYALGKLEALGVDVSAAKAAQLARAAKKAAAAEAKLAADVADELAQLKALGLEVTLGDATPSAPLLAQLRTIRKAATAAAAEGYDVAASAASFAQSTFPGTVTTAYLEAAFKLAVAKIDLLDQAAVTKLLNQVPTSRAGSKLVAAAKKAKASAASKAAAQTKALKAADELKATTGVAFAPETSLATLNAAKKALAALDEQVGKYASAGHAGMIATARHNAKQKLLALGVTPEGLAGLEAKWAATPLGPATPAPAIAAATNAPAVLDPLVVLAKQVGPQAGTNPGGRFLGSDGVTRYVKFYADPAQAHGEALANALYRDLGLRAPKSGIGLTAEGKTFFASELLDVTGTVGKGPLSAADASEILEGFAADILVANWDAVGTGLDNVVRLAGGGIARIDQGGAFLFRAQGGLKAKVKGYGAKGLTEIREFDTLFTENAYYREVFKAAGVTPDTLGPVLTEAVQRITALEHAVGGWATYVDQMVPALAAAERTTIAEMLTARAAKLRARAKVPLPTAAPTAPAPAATTTAAFDALPYQISEAQAAQLVLEGPAAKPFYFQSGKTSLAKLEQGIELGAAPTEFGIQAFPVTASPGIQKHGTAVVSQFVLQPTRPLLVDVAGLGKSAQVQKAVRSVVEDALGTPIGAMTPAQVAEALRAKGFDAVLLLDAGGAQQALILDPRIAKLVKAPKAIGFSPKAVPWQPTDPKVLAAEKAAAEAAERERLANLPVDPAELEVPGLPAPPAAITGRKTSIGLDEAPDATHLLSDRERRLVAGADELLDRQPALAALGGSRTSLKDAFARAGRHAGYAGNAEQKALHTLVTELGAALAKREGLTVTEFRKAEKALVGFIKEWSGSSDSRGAEVLKLLAERLRPGNVRTMKAGNGFFDHQARSYAAFVKSARQYLEKELAGTGLGIEQFAAAYDAYVVAQRAVLRAAFPDGTIRVTRGVDKTTFFKNQGVTRKQFGSSVIVAHNSLSSFSAGSGFSGVKFRATVPIDDIEFHYLLIRRSEFWGEAEVWLIGRPRRMELDG